MGSISICIFLELGENASSLPVTLSSNLAPTLMGLGAFPASDDKWLGMLGMHGTYEANMAMHTQHT